MVYGTKWEYKWLNGTGRTCHVEIQQDGYSSSVTSLVPAPDGMTVEWGEGGNQNLTKPLHISRATLRFIGNADAEAMLDEVFDSPDKEYRVKFTVAGSLEWQGYLATDLRRYNPWRESETVKLEAVDGLAYLKNQNAVGDDSDPAPDTLAVLFRKILRSIHDLDIYTSMDWHSKDPTIGSDESPLDVYRTPKSAYKNLDDNGDLESYVNRKAQLKDLLQRFGLRLRLDKGAWHIRQRDQVQDGTALKRWKMGTAESSFGTSPTTDDVSASLPATSSSRRPVSGVQRLRNVKSSYGYEDLDELVFNGSFEDSLNTWQTTGTVNRIQYSNAGISETQTQGDEYLIKMEDGTLALPSGDEGSFIEQDLPVNLFDSGPGSALTVSWDVMDTYNGAGETETRIRLGNYYVQARRVEIASDTNPAEDGTLPLKSSVPGSNSTIIAPKDATLRTGDASADENPGEITLSEPARAGDNVLQGEINTKVKQGDYVLFFVWSDTTTTSFEGTKEHYGLLNALLDYPTPLENESAFNPQKLTIPLHTPDGTSLVDKQPGFAVWSDNEYTTYLDHVSMVQTVNGEPIEATVYTTQDDHFGQERKISHRIGAGPTASHPRRIFEQGGADLLGDWKPSPYNGGSGSGKGLEQLTAEQWMRQRRESLDRRTYEVEIRGEDVSPTRVYNEGGNAYTVENLRRTWSTSGDSAHIELVQIKDAGLSGLSQSFGEMESGTGTVAGSAGSAGSGASPSVTWDGLTGTLTGDVPIDIDNASGIPDTAGIEFVTGTPSVEWQRDAQNDHAFKVRDTSNGKTLMGVDEDGNFFAAGEVSAYTNSSNSTTSVNSTLAVSEDGNTLTQDAAELDFKGDVTLTQTSTDVIEVDVQGGTDYTDADAVDAVRTNATTDNHITVGGSSGDINFGVNNLWERPNESFTVGGSTGEYYPVLINIDQREQTGISEFVLHRPNTNEGDEGDGSFVGSFQVRIQFTSAEYGNLETRYTIDYIKGTGDYPEPLARIEDGGSSSGNEQVVVWLRGNLTYYFVGTRDINAGIDDPNSHGGSVTDNSGTTWSSQTSRNLYGNVYHMHGSYHLGIGVKNALKQFHIGKDAMVEGNLHLSNEINDWITISNDEHLKYFAQGDIKWTVDNTGEVYPENGINLMSQGDLTNVNTLNVKSIDSNNSNSAINVTQPLKIDGSNGNSENWTVKINAFNAGGQGLTMGGGSYITFWDGDNVFEFGGEKARSHPGTGVTLTARSNPANGDALFEVQSSGGSQRLRVEHKGTTSTSNPFHADGKITTDSEVHADGNISSDGEVTAYASSDSRLKTDITPVGDPLGMLRQVTGYGFRWNEDAPDYKADAGYGLIAQEVREVMPEAVRTNSDGYLGLQYEQLHALEVEAIKALDRKIDTEKERLRQRVEELEKEVQRLKG